MLPLFLKVVARLRPREGWIPFLLILAALLCPAAALLALDVEFAAGGLVILTLLAALAGKRLAHSRFTARAATFWAGLLGVGLVVLVVGQLLPPLSLLWRDALRAGAWLAPGRDAMGGQVWPFAASAGHVWQHTVDLGTRLWWWSQTVASGGPARDPIALALLTALFAWAAGFFAAWQVFRRGAPLAGLVPTGVAIATISFFRGGMATFYLLLYLFCTLALVAAWHLRTLEQRWQQSGTDYPGDLGLELSFALSASLTAILLVASFFPVIGPRQVQDAFWTVMERPWAAVERVAEQLFGPIEHGAGPGRPSAGGTLPRSHLLGSGPELSETIVMYVQTNDPPPPLPDPEDPAPVGATGPRRYWRSVTYDTYTGRGWTNGPLEERTTPQGQRLDPDPFPGANLVQQYELLLAQDNQIYAVNSPLQIDRTVQSWWRAPGDLVQINSSATSYTAISRPPQPTVAELRRVATTPAPGAMDRYLALPEGIPQRVLDLAHQVADASPTPYEKARAIETYLRVYTYTLDLPAPPAARDLVDYFLFDVQQGYCDYYASAMVVMARAVGLPARLAVGYAQGTYDHERQRWVITEKDGHSWVEVFFDGIGWVEFEPTAGLPALERPGGRDLPLPKLPALPQRALRWWQRLPWPLLGMGLVALLAAAVIALSWRMGTQRDLVAAELVRDRHSRLLRWGARLGRPLRDGQTPSEYGAALGSTLDARGRESRWPQARRAANQAPAEVERLTESFVRAQFSQNSLDDREGWQIRDLWTRLRTRLWWLWLGKR